MLSNCMRRLKENHVFWIPYISLLILLLSYPMHVDIKILPLSIGLLILCLIGCQSDTHNGYDNTLTIGIPSDPQKLHPAFNPSSKAREIFQNVFLPLADYDPETLTLIPILVESLPDGRVIDNNTVAYEIKIKEQATWADGTPITGHDITFAYKALSHPQSQTSSWKPYLKTITDITVDKSSNKTLTITCESTAMNTMELALTLYPLQESQYDPLHHLRSYTLPEWIAANSDEQVLTSDTTTLGVITRFNQPESYRTNLHHAGPYQVQEWVTDQYVLLTKIPDYWASSNQSNPYLQAGSDTLLFKIIDDENSLATLLKTGGIDLTMALTPQQYLELSNDPVIGNRYDYFPIETMKIAYLGLNNRDPELQDVAVRKAIAHTIDITTLLETEENGLGTPVSLLVHPSKRYYPDHLPPLAYDLAEASRLLDEAGWKDTDGNGVRDKIVNGNQEELSIDFYLSGSSLTTTIALLLQDAANKVGYQINVIQKDARSYIKENVMAHNYEMAALMASYNEADPDPYIKWHSESTATTGRNRSGFTTPALDSIITLIREESDSEIRTRYYTEFCQILYDGVPVIPLYAPVDIITVDKRYRGVTSSKRPGYMANTFTLQE